MLWLLVVTSVIVILQLIFYSTFISSFLSRHFKLTAVGTEQLLYMSNIADLALYKPKLICSTVSNSLTEKETILFNSVIVYKDMYTVKNISNVVNNYF